MTAPADILSYGRAESDLAERTGGEAWALASVAWFGWLFGGLVLLALAGVAATFLLPTGAYLAAVFVIVPVAYAHNLRRLRRRRAAALVEHLATAARLRLPFVRHVAAARLAEGGGGLDRLLHRLQQGDAVATALRKAAPYADARTLARLRAAEGNGDLPRVLAEEADRLADRAGPAVAGESAAVPQGAYFLLVAALGVLMVTLLLYFVVPKYEDIFVDFDIKMPASTRALLGVSRWLADFGGLFVLIAIALLAMWWMLAAALRDVFMPRPRWRPTAALWERISPGARAARRAVALEALGRGLERGRTLSAAARAAAAGAGDNMLKFAKIVESGGDAATAARVAKLGGPAAGLIGAAERARALPETLLWLAARERVRAERAATWARAAAGVGGTLVLGLIVGFIAVALFEPLVVLADSAMPWEVTP